MTSRSVRGILSWRWSFRLLSIPGLVLALVVRRRLSSPPAAAPTA